MPYSTFTPGFGSTISYAATTVSGGVYTVSGTYAKIAQSIDLASPEIEIGDIKLTNNDSPNQSHEYAPGLLEPGEIQFEWIYTPAEQATIYGITGDGNVYSFKETFSDGSNFIWLGWIKKIGVETKTEDNANKGKVTIRCKSKPAFSIS
jgi:hypothetical protein